MIMNFESKVYDNTLDATIDKVHFKVERTKLQTGCIVNTMAHNKIVQDVWTVMETQMLRFIRDYQHSYDFTK